MKEYLIVKRQIVLIWKNVPKTEWNRILGTIQNIPKRIYDPYKKLWYLPRTYENLRILKQLGFEKKFKGKFEFTPLEISKHYDSPLPLFKFQREGLDFLITMGGNALLADDMGLGKTIQTISYLEYEKEKKTLIVCPSCVKFVWEMEIEKWLGEETSVFKNDKEYVNTRITITNYDRLYTNSYFFNKQNYEIIIFDEAHMIKNPESQRGAASKYLATSPTVKHVIGLTGTPVENRPIDIFALLQLVRPDVFFNKQKFVERYCGAKWNGFGINDKGHSNVEELNQLLISTCMIRRTKEEVLPDLPSKTITVMPVEIENRAKYNLAKKDYLKYLTKYENRVESEYHPMAKREKLKQIAVAGKMKMIYNFVESNIATSNQKLVIMCVRHSTIDSLMEKYGKIAVKIDGRINDKERKIAVTRFQEDPKVKIFVGQIVAAGTGITLTAASNVLFPEFTYKPTEHDQASDRIYRIGQKFPCNITYMIGINTIDEEAIQLFDEKRKVITAIVDGKEVEDTAVLTELIKKYQ